MKRMIAAILCFGFFAHLAAADGKSTKEEWISVRRATTKRLEGIDWYTPRKARFAVKLMERLGDSVMARQRACDRNHSALNLRMLHAAMRTQLAQMDEVGVILDQLELSGFSWKTKIKGVQENIARIQAELKRLRPALRKKKMLKVQRQRLIELRLEAEKKLKETEHLKAYTFSNHSKWAGAASALWNLRSVFRNHLGK